MHIRFNMELRYLTGQRILALSFAASNGVLEPNACRPICKGEAGDLATLLGNKDAFVSALKVQTMLACKIVLFS